MSELSESTHSKSNSTASRHASPSPPQSPPNILNKKELAIKIVGVTNSNLTDESNHNQEESEAISNESLLTRDNVRFHSDSIVFKNSKSKLIVPENIMYTRSESEFADVCGNKSTSDNTKLNGVSNKGKKLFARWQNKTAEEIEVELKKEISHHSTSDSDNHASGFFGEYHVSNDSSGSSEINEIVKTYQDHEGYCLAEFQHLIGLETVGLTSVDDMGNVDSSTYFSIEATGRSDDNSDE